VTVPIPCEVNEEETIISLLLPVTDCVLPDDNVHDELATPRVAERCATAQYPIRAPAVLSPNSVASVFARSFQLSTEEQLNQSVMCITATL
jgi:hypothetical protein